MSNSIAPGSSADVNVKVTALTTNPNVPVTYKTIILKKNLVNGVNTLTQEMMSAANTKYVIKYDYTLAEDITVPENCVLEFDGGSISGNGTSKDTITGNNTCIEAGLIKIFNTNVIFSGSWVNNFIYAEWFGVVGDGITDDTSGIQKIIDTALKIRIPIKLSAKSYIISQTIIIDDTYGMQPWESTLGIFMIGETPSTTIFLSKINNNTPVLYFKNYNNGTQSNGFLFKNFSIASFSNSFNNLYDGIKLENSMGVIFKNVQVSSARNAIYLTSKSDTSISPQNVGYCEMNKFILCSASGINCVLFEGEEINTSFHGNYFIACSFSVGNVSNVSGVTPCVLKLNKGMIYNCIFDIKSFVGNNAQLLYINAVGRENSGNLRYEVTGDYAKIVTGPYANAVFMMHGNIFGYGDLNFSDYHPVSVGEVLTYNNDGTPSTYVTSDYDKLGRDKLFVDNVYPSKNVTDGISLGGNSLEIIPDKNDLENSYYRANATGFYRYTASNGSTEEGLLIAGRNRQLKSRTTYGVIPIKSNITDVEKGLDIYNDGSEIVSYNGSISKIVFDNGIVKVGNNNGSVPIVRVFADWLKPSESTKIKGYLNIGDEFFYQTNNRPAWYNGTDWLDSEGFPVDAKKSGAFANKPSFPFNKYYGFNYFNVDTDKYIVWNGYTWRDYDGVKCETRRVGNFSQKPKGTDIYVGFHYFCLDKQTAEGGTDGIEIIFKGQDTTDPDNPVDVWVDALGRVVS